MTSAIDKIYTTRRVCYNCDHAAMIVLPYLAEFVPYDRELRSASLESGYITKDKERITVHCTNCGLPRLT